MNIDDRELANLIERAFNKWAGDNKEEYGNFEEFFPTDEEFKELAQRVLKDIKEIKGKWVI